MNSECDVELVLGVFTAFGTSKGVFPGLEIEGSQILENEEKKLGSRPIDEQSGMLGLWPVIARVS